MPPGSATDKLRGCGYLIAVVVPIALIAVGGVVLQSIAASHPTFFVNRPGWAESSAFLSGFLTVALVLFWLTTLAYFSGGRSGRPPNKAMAWLVSLAFLPVVTVTGGFAMLALPPRYSDDCGGSDPEAPNCAYLHTHPFAVLTLFLGGLAGVAVVIAWFTIRRRLRAERRRSSGNSPEAPAVLSGPVYWRLGLLTPPGGHRRRRGPCPG